MRHLAETLIYSNCKLNSLNLSGNIISNESVKHLAEALTHRNCKLNSLNLSSDSMSDESMKNLAEALIHDNYKLNSLTVFYYGIGGPEAVRHLAESAAHTANYAF